MGRPLALTAKKESEEEIRCWSAGQNRTDLGNQLGDGTDEVREHHGAGDDQDRHEDSLCMIHGQHVPVSA